MLFSVILRKFHVNSFRRKSTHWVMLRFKSLHTLGCFISFKLNLNFQNNILSIEHAFVLNKPSLTEYKQIAQLARLSVQWQWKRFVLVNIAPQLWSRRRNMRHVDELEYYNETQPEARQGFVHYMMMHVTSYKHLFHFFPERLQCTIFIFGYPVLTLITLYYSWSCTLSILTVF